MFTFKDHESNLKLKSEIKTMAIRIKEAKGVLKKSQRNGSGDWKLNAAVRQFKQEFRNHHIAASMLRGTDLLSIERPREGNEPDMNSIMKIIAQYGMEVSNETLCSA